MTVRALVWLVLIGLVACVPARRRVAGDIVRNVHFTGNGGLFSGQNDLQLRRPMEQQSSAFGLMIWPLKYLVEPKTYVPEQLTRDAYRLEVWYAHHGYLDAKVIGWTTRRVRDRKARRAGIVDIRGHVEPGEASLVRKLEVVGVTPGTRPYANLIERTGFQQPGKVFLLASAETDRTNLEVQLKNANYAYAEVDLRVDAHPESRAVDVALHMDPGEQCTIGPITIEGNEAVATKLIQQNLRIQEGQPYRIKDLAAAQSRLFGMQTFSLVTVKPDLSDPTVKAVPIKVEVTENRFRSLQFGIGLRTQNILNWEPHVSTRFRHTHLFHQLIRAELYAKVGLSGYSPSPKIANQIFPVWRFSGTLTYPRIFGQRVAQQVQVEVERAFDQALALHDNPEVDVRTIWRPSDPLVIQFGPHFEYVSYVDRTLLDNARRFYGPEFDGSYLLTSFDTSLTVDWRDDPLSAKRGSFFNGTLRYAFPFITADDYHFLAFSGDWRYFLPVRIGDDVPITFATRVHGKVLFPIGDDGIPYAEKLFLGGSANMRGFPSRGMGPYQTLVTQRTNDAGETLTTVSYLPNGGTFGIVLEEELRYHTGFGLTYAAFVDAGTLSNPWGSLTGEVPEPFVVGLLEGFRVAGGLGLRYGSPIGPIRFDLAVRPRYPEDDCPANYPSCRLGSRLQRRLDLIRTFDADAKGPGVMLFFAFGEAI